MQFDDMQFRYPVISIFVILIISGATACTSAGTIGQMTATAIATSSSAVPSPTQPADVLIKPVQYNQPITLQIGQTLRVEPPNLDSKWHVEFDYKHLKVLTPPALMFSPSQDGWLFEGIARGEAQITLSSIVVCNQPPCPLMPMQFILRVDVK